MIADELAERIHCGIYTPRNGLPRQDELCREFKTSRSNIHKVLTVMQKRGLIARSRGKRTVPDISTPSTTLLYLYFSSLPDEENNWGCSMMVQGLLYRGIQRYAEGNKVRVLLQSGRSFVENGCEFLEEIDGIVLTGVGADTFFVNNLVELKKPICMIGFYHRLAVDVVSADYYEGGEQAGEILRRSELKHPAVLSMSFKDSALPSLREIQNGFINYTGDHGISIAFSHCFAYDDLAQRGGAVQSFERKIQENNVDSLIFCGAVPFSFVRKLPGCSMLPAIVVDYSHMISGAWNTEVIGFDAMRIGFTAAARVCGKIRDNDMKSFSRDFYTRTYVPCLQFGGKQCQEYASNRNQCDKENNVT